MKRQDQELPQLYSVRVRVSGSGEATRNNVVMSAGKRSCPDLSVICHLLSVVGVVRVRILRRAPICCLFFASLIKPVWDGPGCCAGRCLHIHDGLSIIASCFQGRDRDRHAQEECKLACTHAPQAPIESGRRAASAGSAGRACIYSCATTACAHLCSPPAARVAEFTPPSQRAPSTVIHRRWRSGEGTTIFSSSQDHRRRAGLC